MTATPQPRANPYVGPRAFQQGEKLYGRDREVTQLLHLLMAERIALLYSLSGAGKTSLIQAALIPELEKEGFHVLPSMRVSLGPSTDEQLDASSNRYVLSLLLSLEEALPPEQRTPLAELSTLTLGEYLDRRRDGDEAVGTVLIFDQFEEILTLDPLDRELKLEFFAQVGAALRDRRRWALFAMREEFIAGLEEPYLRPIPTRLRTSYRLGLLVPECAKQAIQEPAKAAGVTFTDAAADKLVRDLSTVRVLQPDGSLEERLGPYVEPVQLQVVCRRLWELLPGGASQIAEEDIGLLADVDLALSGYYDDQVKAALSGYYADRFGAFGSVVQAAMGFVTERTIRNWFDRKLIMEQGIRGQVLEGPEESEGLDNRAIRPLVGAHLVRAERRRGATWLELAHDRLIEPVQTSNAAWRRARLIRWIAAGAALISILVIALACFAWSREAALSKAETQLAFYEDSSATIGDPPSGTTLNAGEVVTFTGSARDGKGKDLTASLSWLSSRDGAIGTGGFFTPSLSAGRHTITASATVSGGLTIVDAITITVNGAPVATIRAPADGASFDGGDPITFTGSARDGEDRDLTASLSWLSSRDGAIGTGGFFTPSLSAGRHTITASATVSGGLTIVDAITITVSRPISLPSATIGDPPSGTTLNAGEVVTFTGSARDGEDGDLTASLLWESSLDGAIGWGGTFRRSDLSEGSHTITAAVTASRGLTASNAITITVSRPISLPSATISAPADGASFDEGDPITFTGSARDGKGKDLTASLSWLSSLDGAIGRGGTFTRSDLSVGSHTITASATVSGGLTIVDAITITVNGAPVATIYAPANRASFDQGDPITFTGSARDAAGSDLTASLSWESSLDGAIGRGGTFTRSDLSVGRHTITAGATVSGGLTIVDAITITVNGAPVATIYAPANRASFDGGDPITFTGNARDAAGSDLTASLSWESSLDGAIGTAGSFTRSDLSVGRHTITAAVTDSGGLTDSDQITLIIGPLCPVEAQGRFAGLWQRYRTQLGCPIDEAPRAIRDAEQAFENGRMFWRADNLSIYVIYERGDRAGTFQRFVGKRWEGDGPVCPYAYPCQASPPQGFFPPQRGFRVAWCYLCAENAPIGWALAGELGFGPYNKDPLVQEFDRGLIFRDSEGKTQGQAYVLFSDWTFVRVGY